jgi:hypothetical protein
MNTRKPNEGSKEVALRWSLYVLSGIAALGALLRVFSPSGWNAATRLDQTTLLYLGVAGALLLLRQVKTFSMGQLKFELIERLRERQDKQEERLTDISLVLPLLLPGREVKHVKNLFAHTTTEYAGGHSLRGELRRLRSIGLLTMKQGRSVSEMKDGTQFDLASYVDLTELGRKWATRIQEIELSDSIPRQTQDQDIVT